MSNLLKHLKKTSMIFGAAPDESKVQEQVEELQHTTPPLQSKGVADGGTDIIRTLLKKKDKAQHAHLSEDGGEPFQYRGEHPTTKSEGLDSSYSMADLGSSVTKISKDKEAKEIGKNVSMYDVKGKSAPPPKGKKVLLRTPESVKLSAFMGGVLNGFEKAGHKPDVDPGILFDEIVDRLPTEATAEEQAEVKAAFVENW